MALQPNGPAPYTSVTAATAALDAFRERGLGTPVTPEILTRAGVPESISRRTLQSLATLELVTDDGRPTSQWEELRVARGEDEYRTRLQSWLRGIYADVLQYADPGTHTLDRIVEAFRSYEPAGQRRPMAALLLGLWKYAGLPLAEGETTRPSAARTTIRTPTAKARQGASRSTSSRARGGDNPGNDLPPALLGLLREVPTDGKSWTTTTRDTFLKAFAAVLDFSVPVDDTAPWSTEGDDEEAFES